MHYRIAQRENCCYVNYILLITFASNKGLSKVKLLPIRVRSIQASVWFSTVKWSKKTVVARGNISRRSRSALRCMRYGSSLTYLLQQKCNFMSY